MLLKRAERGGNGVEGSGLRKFRQWLENITVVVTSTLTHTAVSWIRMKGVFGLSWLAYMLLCQGFKSGAFRERQRLESHARENEVMERLYDGISCKLAGRTLQPCSCQGSGQVYVRGSVSRKTTPRRQTMPETPQATLSIRETPEPLIPIKSRDIQHHRSLSYQPRSTTICLR